MKLQCGSRNCDGLADPVGHTTTHAASKQYKYCCEISSSMQLLTLLILRYPKTYLSLACLAHFTSAPAFACKRPLNSGKPRIPGKRPLIRSAAGTACCTGEILPRQTTGVYEKGSRSGGPGSTWAQYTALMHCKWIVSCLVETKLYKPGEWRAISRFESKPIAVCLRMSGTYRQ